MRRISGLAIVLLSAVTIALAQNADTPRAEVFGGYSFASIDDQGLIGHHISLNGWNSSVAFNVNRTLGVVSDFGGYYGSPGLPPVAIALVCPVFGCNPVAPGGSIHADTKVHTFLFGPQLNFRSEGMTPFVHALFGAAHTTATPTGGTSLSDTGFGMALGGGIDANFSRHVGFRVQGDYLQTRLFILTEKNFRVSTGLVFHFGK